MKGKTLLYLDQYGRKIFARTVKELKEKAGPGRVFKIYRDAPEGGAVHTGYGVGHSWFEAF